MQKYLTLILISTSITCFGVQQMDYPNQDSIEVVYTSNQKSTTRTTAKKQILNHKFMPVSEEEIQKQEEDAFGFSY